jgi:hypothetical protein
MKTGSPIMIVAICASIFVMSCTKNSGLVPTSTVEERVGGSTKFMNVLLYTKTAYDQHDAHSYAGGHILEFHNSDWQALQSVNSSKMQTALAYMKHAVLTGDTTGQYLNLFTYVITNASYMDAYPDSALIYGPNYTAFKTWFQNTCTNWMTANNCKNIVSNTNADWYLLKIRCGAN